MWWLRFTENVKLWPLLEDYNGAVGRNRVVSSFFSQKKRSVVPTLFNLAVHLLAQVADRRGAYAGAPQELGDVLHVAHGYACQVHLDERLLPGRIPAPAAIYDGRLDSASDECFQVVLESGFVDLPCAPLSGICEGEYTLPPWSALDKRKFLNVYFVCIYYMRNKVCFL